MLGEEAEQKEGAAPGGSVRVAFTYMYHFLCVYLFIFVLGFFFLHICIISYFCFGGFFTYMCYLLLVYLFLHISIISYFVYFCFGGFLHICVIYFLFFFFFYIYVLFLICSFICSFLAALGLCNHPQAFSSCPEQGLLSSCVRASPCGGFSAAQSSRPRAQAWGPGLVAPQHVGS